MENFNNLFATAEQTADKRRKVFNELKQKVVSEILPAYCKACKAYELKHTFFTFYTPIISDHYLSFVEADGDEVYAISINVQNETIEDCVKNEGNEYLNVPSYQPNENYSKPFSEVTFLNTGIITFITQLSNRLENLNKKYEKLNETAKELLDN